MIARVDESQSTEGSSSDDINPRLSEGSPAFLRLTVFSAHTHTPVSLQRSQNVQ